MTLNETVIRGPAVPNFLTSFFQTENYSQASVAQLVEPCPRHQEVGGLISSQGTIPSRGHLGGNQSIFLSLPLPFSALKIKKNIS